MKAFANFFAKRARYPKYKKRQSEQTIRFQIDLRVVASYFQSGEWLRLPGLDALKMRWSRISSLPCRQTWWYSENSHDFTRNYAVEN
ncbi:transposase [Gammaproteobacteria bacterium]